MSYERLYHPPNKTFTYFIHENKDDTPSFEQETTLPSPFLPLMSGHSPLVIILILVFSFDSYSQEKENFIRGRQPPPGFKYAKSTIGLSAGICFFQNIKPQSGFNHKYEFEKSTFAYGAEVAWNISKRHALNSGVYFSKFKYQVNYEWIYNSTDPSIPIYSDLTLNHLTVPLNYNYAFLVRRYFASYLIIGGASTFLTSSMGTATYSDNSVRGFDYLEKNIFGYQVGLGIQYRFNVYSALKIESTYRSFQKGFDSIMFQQPGIISISLSIVTRIDWKCIFKRGSWRPLPVCN
jgi:opacity protein-like surface antigen